MDTNKYWDHGSPSPSQVMGRSQQYTANPTSQNYLSSTLQQMLPVYSVAQFSQTTGHYHYNIWTEKCSHRNASNVTDYNVNLFAAVKQKQSKPISQFCSITRHATSCCLSIICDGSIHWSLSNVTCWRTDTCIGARLRLMTLKEQVSNISTHQRLTTTHECEQNIYKTHTNEYSHYDGLSPSVSGIAGVLGQFLSQFLNTAKPNHCFLKIKHDKYSDTKSY